MVIERKFEDLVREGVARMKARGKAERQVTELARQYSDIVARELIMFARCERVRLRHELEVQFGFTAIREQEHLRCRFASPQRAPRTVDQKMWWVDAVVALSGFELAQEAMFGAAAYFPWPDQPRKVCDAFSDVMLEAPAAYNAFAASQLFDQPVRAYTSAMAAAWARSHLRKFPGSRMKEILEGEDWAQELANATSLAWQELGPDSPIKRTTRFRDTLERQKDGRRQKAPGPPDFVNLVDRFLSGRETRQGKVSRELEFATFFDREALLRRGREAGLPPREYQYLKLWAAKPRISYSAAASKLRISKGAVKRLKHNVMNTLRAS
jgi:DNA-binding CsgD family transcriptional regulator